MSQTHRYFCHNTKADKNISLFFASGTKLPKNCFRAWFVILDDKSVKIYYLSMVLPFEKRLRKKARDVHYMTTTLHKNLTFLFSSCAALVIKYFPILN